MVASKKQQKADGDTWLAEMQRSMERANAPLFTIGSQQFTPAQARELLPDLIAFINHHHVMDDYTRIFGNRVDPAHEHVWLLLDTWFDERGPYAKFRCEGCSMDLHLELASHAMVDNDMWAMSKRTTGLDIYALHDRFTAFSKKTIEIFANEKFGDDLRRCSKNT